jgi:hypothetical protein
VIKFTRLTSTTIASAMQSLTRSKSPSLPSTTLPKITQAATLNYFDLKSRGVGPLESGSDKGEWPQPLGLEGICRTRKGCIGTTIPAILTSSSGTKGGNSRLTVLPVSIGSLITFDKLKRTQAQVAQHVGDHAAAAVVHFYLKLVDSHTPGAGASLVFALVDAQRPNAVIGLVYVAGLALGVGAVTLRLGLLLSG